MNSNSKSKMATLKRKESTKRESQYKQQDSINRKDPAHNIKISVFNTSKEIRENNNIK